MEPLSLACSSRPYFSKQFRSLSIVHISLTPEPIDELPAKDLFIETRYVKYVIRVLLGGANDNKAPFMGALCFTVGMILG